MYLFWQMFVLELDFEEEERRKNSCYCTLVCRWKRLCLSTRVEHGK